MESKLGETKMFEEQNCGNCRHASLTLGWEPIYQVYSCARNGKNNCSPLDICWCFPKELKSQTYIEEFCDNYQEANW